MDWPAQRIGVRRNDVRGVLGTPKSKRSSRAVPLADILGGEPDQHYKAPAYKADADLVFAHPHTGGPMDRSNLRKHHEQTLRRTEIRDVRFHDLRHTFGTRMAAAGVPMRMLQEWMGHRDFKTTLIHADYAPGADEAALVNAAMRGINSGISLGELSPTQIIETLSIRGISSERPPVPTGGGPGGRGFESHRSPFGGLRRAGALRCRLAKITPCGWRVPAGRP